MTKINLLLISLFINITAFGQARIIDMAITMNSPVEGAVYEEGQNIPVNITLRNNGPHNLVAGDSIFLIMTDIITTLPQNTQLIILEQDIPPFVEVELFDRSYRVQNMPANWDLSEYCAQIADDPSTQVTQGGNPILVSYIDPIPGNNGKCSRITVNKNPTAIEAIETEHPPVLYPNPANKLVHIEFPNKNNMAPITVSITDITGKQIVMQEHYAQSSIAGKEQFILNIDQLRKGIYFIEMTYENNRWTEKLVVVD